MSSREKIRVQILWILIIFYFIFLNSIYTTRKIIYNSVSERMEGLSTGIDVKKQLQNRNQKSR